MHKLPIKRGMAFAAILLFSVTSLLSSQTPEIRLNSAVQFLSDETQSAPDAIHIVALMVDFQRDDNDYTSGDGSFHLDYLDRDDILIDPLPHDRGYFEAHLEFAKNYFERVSGNQLTVTYEVLPEVYTLDNEMAEYSPLGEDGAENYKYVNLVRDSWAKAYADNALDFDGYDMDNTMFIVFHAGAGRDIELIGTTLNKTPQDIPSVYLGFNAMQRLLDNPDFEGFPTNTPDFYIRNTAILPQTESRAGEDIIGDEFVLELSINGILTANIGSFLGLPDLFNTETGRAGIGRFGLMDGASIFSYLGMFPPELSAWEKMYLGWINPFDIIDIDLDSDEAISLPAVSQQYPNVIARHHISQDEYFLVENRHRDPQGNGVTLTIREPNGSHTKVTIASDDERFNPFNDSEYEDIPGLVPGVVVNVSNFDFSLPGGPMAIAIDDDDIDEEDEGRVLNGGMLIWHIDDAVIRRTIDNNRINTNVDRRGVRLVEADGAQQIGYETFGLETSRYINGHAFDFWWSGNDFEVILPSGASRVAYQNRFGPDTQPANHSNTGSRSYFEFYDFSDNLPTASFYARIAEPEFARPYRFVQLFYEEDSIFNTEQNKAYPLGINAAMVQSDTMLVIPTQHNLQLVPISSSDYAYHRIPGKVLSMPLITGNELVISQERDEEHVFRKIELEDQSNYSTIWQNNDVPFPQKGFVSLNSDTELAVDLTTFRLHPTTGQTLPELSQPRQESASGNPGSYLESSNLRFTNSNNSISWSETDFDNYDRAYTGIIHSGNGNLIYALFDDELMLISFDGNEPESEIIHSGSSINWPAMIDYSGDGFIDFLFIDTESNELMAVNQTGALLSNFPLRAPGGKRFTGTPLIADITGDGYQELIMTTQDSLSVTLHAYDRNLRQLDGFPLFVGSVSDETADPIHPAIIGNKLVAVSHIGEVRSWSFPEMGTTTWATAYGTFANNKVSSATVSGSTPERDFTLLNKRETYNWPNPATDQTNIRFETRESADVTITVINMAGNKVAEYTAFSHGSQPQELNISTLNWGSGVYYARVRASNGSTSESELIKIVVIR